MPVWFNRRLGRPSGSNLYTVGAMADSYYEYLLKLWLLHQKQVSSILNRMIVLSELQLFCHEPTIPLGD